MMTGLAAFPSSLQWLFVPLASVVCHASLSGVGSAMHMQAAKFVSLAHISDPVHIPFKGTPEALVAIMAGDADFIFAPRKGAAAGDHRGCSLVIPA